MSRDLTYNERQAIQRLVADAGLAAVLTGLSDVCSEQAANIAEYQNDMPLARRWFEVEKLIAILVHKVSGL
jgi:hypothetical protein